MAQDRIDDDEMSTELQDRLPYASDGQWDVLLAGLPYLAWCDEQRPPVDDEPVAES
jgi:hypothetical protein